MLHKVDSERFRAASVVGGATELQTIRLLKLDSFVGNMDGSGVQDGTLVYDLSANHSFVEEQRKLIVQIKFGLKSLGAKQTSAGSRGICVKATYESTYEFKVDPPPPDSRDFFFEGFAIVSGVHHLWPFWRELVFSLTQKFGIEPIVLPLIKFQPETKEIAEAPKKPKKKLPSDKRIKRKRSAEAHAKH